MSTEQILLDRSHSKCELCTSESDLAVYEVPPTSDSSPEQCILLCKSCRDQIDGIEDLEPNHWRGLSDAMWSPVLAVQVMAWRQLKQLSESEAWAQDLLDMLYLNVETQAWAEAGLPNEAETGSTSVDSNGAPLAEGDSVTLIKDLDVKGTNFTAKRGTLVKNIHLTDNHDHIEGRVNGTLIVLLTKFLKKA